MRSYKLAREGLPDVIETWLEGRLDFSLDRIVDELVAKRGWKLVGREASIGANFWGIGKLDFKIPPEKFPSETRGPVQAGVTVRMKIGRLDRLNPQDLEVELQAHVAGDKSKLLKSSNLTGESLQYTGRSVMRLAASAMDDALSRWA